MIQRMNRFGNGRGDSCLAIAVLIVDKILYVETKAAKKNSEIDLRPDTYTIHLHFTCTHLLRVLIDGITMVWANQKSETLKSNKPFLNYIKTTCTRKYSAI